MAAGVDAAMTAAMTAAVFSARYRRQVSVPGFRQDRLTGTAVQLHPRGHTDRVMLHASWLLAAIGCEHITQVGAPLQMAELMRFNPRLVLRAVPPALANDWRSTVVAERAVLVAYEAGEGVALSLSRTYAREAQELGTSSPLPLYVTPTRDTLFVGPRMPYVGGALPDPAGAPQDSALELLAAALLVGFALRRMGAWHSPHLIGMGEPLARLIDPGPPSHCRWLGTLLLVGGGGALSHAFLMAVLGDRHLRAAIDRIVIVDPDVYETTNFNRQLLAGDLGNLGRGKAEVTAEELRRRWPATERMPEIVPVAERISATHIERYQPGLSALFPDNVAARALAYGALDALDGSRRALLGGTEFTYGQVRLLDTRSSVAPCANCGPEQLAERALLAARAVSCGNEATPSNVLTNALVGALAALEVRKWMATGEVPQQQMQVNWNWERYHRPGLRFEACTCYAG